ncbi:hypothetical protein [Streptomyces antimycoticus]|nr:hypothetical protein [Streptomyces antimycoticus]
MLTPSFRRLLPAACALASALTLAGCDGDGEKSEDNDASAKTSPAEVRLEEACGGVFDKKIAAEAARSGVDRVTPVKSESPAEAAAGLSKETTWGTGHDLCFLENGRGEELMSLDVAWVAHPVPGGDSVRASVGKPIGGSAGSLEVRCGLNERRTGNRYALEFNLRDAITVSAHSHAKLLIATAKKVTSAMACQKQPQYPAPESVAPAPKPDKYGRVAR